MRRPALLSFLVLLAATAAPLALASEGESGGHGLDWSTIFWKGLNFAVLVALLVKILRKPVVEYFRKRRDQIGSELLEAERGRQEALEKLREIEQKLSKAEAESAEMLAKARSEAALDRERILKAAEEEAQRVRQTAQEEIRRATEVARVELRAYAAELATARAAEILAVHIQQADRERLFRDYLGKIEERLPT